jgi:hypothetical protein
MGFKSDKDKEAFVQKLTAAGFGPEDIAAEVSSVESSAPAPAPVAPPAIKPSSKMGGGQANAEVAPPLAPATPAAVQQQSAQLTAAREDAGNTLSDQLFTADTAKLLAPVAAYGVYKGAQAIKDRMFSSERPQYPTGVEPTMAPEPETPQNKLPPAAQQKTFTPKEAAVASNITNKYPFTLDQAKTGLGIPDVKITNPTDAELVAKQYSRQIQAAVPPPSIPVAEATAPVPPVSTQTVESAATEVTQEKKAKKPKYVQPPGTGAGDNWIHNLGGADFYKDVIRTQNDGKPITKMEDAYKAVNKYANEVGRYKPFQQGAPSMNVQEMEANRPKSGNFGKLPFGAVPPPSLRPAPQLGGGGGSMMRGIGDPLQLKQ